MAHLDLEAVTLTEGSFVERYHAYETDLLARIPYRHHPHLAAYVYILVEHQSTVDKGMPPRMLGYLYQVWRHLVTTKKATWDNLPAVIPLVYYHGQDRWEVPTTITQCIDEPGQALASYGPQLQILVDDISFMEYRELLARHHTPVMRVTATLLVFHGEPEQMLDALADRIDDLLQLSDREQVLVVKYLRDQTGTDTLDQLLAIARERNPQLERVMTTYYQEAIEDFRQDFLQEGREEGRDEVLATMRRAVLAQLQAKFGSISTDHQTKIDHAQPQQLEQWLVNAVTATTPEEVFAPEA